MKIIYLEIPFEKYGEPEIACDTSSMDCNKWYIVFENEALEPKHVHIDADGNIWMSIVHTFKSDFSYKWIPSKAKAIEIVNTIRDVAYGQTEGFFI